MDSDTYDIHSWVMGLNAYTLPLFYITIDGCYAEITRIPTNVGSLIH